MRRLVMQLNLAILMDLVGFMPAIKTVLASILLLFALGGSAISDDLPPRSRAQNEAAAAYAIDGVSFALTPEQFREKFPRARKSDNAGDEKIGLIHYKLLTESASGVSVSFYNGKVNKIRVVYFTDKLKEIGGDRVVLDDLVTRFGKPDPDSKGVISRDPLKYESTWSFMDKTVGKYLEVEGTEKYLMLTMTDLATDAGVLKKKGFIK
jgi:hypothetical protein